MESFIQLKKSKTKKCHFIIHCIIKKLGYLFSKINRKHTEDFVRVNSLNNIIDSRLVARIFAGGAKIF